MSDPLVSVIIPTWNGAAFIGEAIDSVLRQTHRPLEVIIVDDGSTDGTPELVRRFADRVRLVEQPNAGTATARNTGLATAHWENAAFLDHDDLWIPTKLQRQLAVVQNSGACAVYGAVEFFDGCTGLQTAHHCPPLMLDFHA